MKKIPGSSGFKVNRTFLGARAGFFSWLGTEMSGKSWSDFEPELNRTEKKFESLKKPSS